MKVDGKERRKLLAEVLQNAKEPLAGGILARQLKVSRQVIVGDIAILRAAGVEIYATPQGYIMPAIQGPSFITAKLACRHKRNEMAEELAIIIDNGGKVLDVIVEHSVYGEIKANLMLASRRELAVFLATIEASGAEPLSVVTGGVHLHTIEVPSVEVLRTIEEQLKERGLLVE
jgi:hypothetical protein